MGVFGPQIEQRQAIHRIARMDEDERAELEKAIAERDAAPEEPVDDLSDELYDEVAETLEVRKEYVGFDRLVDQLMQKNGWSKDRAEKVAAGIGRRKYGSDFNKPASSHN